MANAFHDVELPEDRAEAFPVVIEIPMGSKCKYVVDRATGILRLDRVLASSTHYPANYGFVPRTRAAAGDALDVLVLMQETLAPLTVVRARAIGVLVMRDEKGVDDKIIAVCPDDPAFAHYQRHDELPPHIMQQLMRFFADYKVLEHKLSKVEALHDRVRALRVIEDAVASYERARASASA